MCNLPICHSQVVIVFALGIDRMGAVRGGGGDAFIRRVLRRGPGIDPLDDHGRAVQPGSPTGRHVHCRPCQLDSQLPGRSLLPPSQGTPSLIGHGVSLIDSFIAILSDFRAGCKITRSCRSASC